ncbi:hypothetical protein B9Z19DRAFT_1124240 [Tuber borchii]|uniref:Uncharacterized protein n=1 Tax=Tuber borchii TaxID=42251 RepID=A0A2T6ZWZ1_TUBBO|nr:hypothetical protein B9Z19DRAFT_1124240 [Tuber borchii]
MALQSLLKGIPGALGMQSRGPFTTVFYGIPSVHGQKGISILPSPMALQSYSWGVRYAIARPL